MKEILDEADLIKLLKEVGAELDIELDGTTPSTTLDSLGLDSLGLYEMLAILEGRLSLRIPDEKVSEIETVDDLVGALIELQKSQLETAADGTGGE